MNKEEQYLLFALSAPMEILNQGCKPAHDSPKMYTGIKEFELSSSWGINNRDDLIQTIYQMTDDGHANDLAGLYLTWHRSSPEEWKALIAGGSERGLIYTQFVAQTAMCCREKPCHFPLNLVIQSSPVRGTVGSSASQRVRSTIK